MDFVREQYAVGSAGWLHLKVVANQSRPCIIQLVSCQVQLNIFIHSIQKENQHPLYEKKRKNNLRQNKFWSHTCKTKSQLNHAFYWFILRSGGQINPQWHAAERTKAPRSTPSTAHRPFKSLPPSVLLFPKCNYKPGEGGYSGLDSLQNTASTPTLGGMKRRGCPFQSTSAPHWSIDGGSSRLHQTNPMLSAPLALSL